MAERYIALFPPGSTWVEFPIEEALIFLESSGILEQMPPEQVEALRIQEDSLHMHLPAGLFPVLQDFLSEIGIEVKK